MLWLNKVGIFAQQRLSFSEDQELYNAASTTWNAMGREDILEAFSHHPQIGADQELCEKNSKQHTLGLPMSIGNGSASEACIADLAKCNRLYLERFGYIFIVCATGRTLAQMLNPIKERLHNSEEQDQNAAAEQEKSPCSGCKN